MAASTSAGVGAAGAVVGAAAGKVGEFFSNLGNKKPDSKESDTHEGDPDINNPEDDDEAESDSKDSNASSITWIEVLQNGVPCALMLNPAVSTATPDPKDVDKNVEE